MGPGSVADREGRARSRAGVTSPVGAGALVELSERLIVAGAPVTELLE